MYEGLEISKRTAKPKDKILKNWRFVSLEQALLVTDSYRSYPAGSRIIQRVRALARVAENISIDIDDDELIIGNRSPGIRDGIVFPEASVAWLGKEFDTLPSREQDPFDVREEDVNQFREEILPFWTGLTLEDRIKDELEKSLEPGLDDFQKVVKINQKDHAQGHIIPDVRAWLEKGPVGLQSVLFLFSFLHLESNASSFSPGRLDQLLYPYYQSDLDAGRLTEEAALELMNQGIHKQDAYDYGVVGCVELSTQGNFLGWSDVAMVNLIKILELTLNNGICLQSGEKLGPDLGNLADFTSYESLESAFDKMVDHFVSRTIDACNRVDRVHSEVLPSPFLSTVVGDCLEKGRDVTAGGAYYNYSGVQGIQVANLADSLYALKRAVFDEGKVGKGELLEAMQNNYAGKEELRLFLRDNLPKYGILYSIGTYSHGRQCRSNTRRTTGGQTSGRWRHVSDVGDGQDRSDRCTQICFKGRLHAGQ